MNRAINVVMFAYGVVLLAPASYGASPIYFSDFGPDTIKRSDRDGTSVQTIYTSPVNDPGSHGVHGLALDPIHNKLYWVENKDNSPGIIKRANLDGSSVDSIAVVDQSSQNAQSTLRDIAVDPFGGHIYFTDNTDFGHNGQIIRANLDGSNLALLAEDFKPDDIELDLVHGKIYWTDMVDREIVRMNLDGTDRETVLVTAFRPFGLALDPVGDVMYYSDNDTANNVARIMRASLDGAGPTPLISQGLQDVRGLAVDVLENKIYWANLGMHSIQRANLDGSGVQNLVTSGLVFPNKVALIPIPVPEPSTFVLMAASLLLVAYYFRSSPTVGRSR